MAIVLVATLRHLMVWVVAGNVVWCFVFYLALSVWDFDAEQYFIWALSCAARCDPQTSAPSTAGNRDAGKRRKLIVYLRVQTL